jgi:hypothetical protein
MGDQSLNPHEDKVEEFKSYEERREEGLKILNVINEKYGRYVRLSTPKGTYTSVGTSLDYSDRLINIKFEEFPEDNIIISSLFNDYGLATRDYGVALNLPIVTLTDFDSPKVEVFGLKMLGRPNIFGTPGGTQALASTFEDGRPVIAKMGVTGRRGIQMLGKLVQKVFGNKGIGQDNKIAIMSNYDGALSQCIRGLEPYLDETKKTRVPFSAQTEG